MLASNPTPNTMMMSPTLLDSLIAQADQISRTKGGLSGSTNGKLKKSMTRESLIDLLSPFSHEKRLVAPRGDFQQEDCEQDSSTMISGQISEPQKAMVMPDTTLQRILVGFPRPLADVRQSDETRHLPKESQEFERAEHPVRTPRLKWTAHNNVRRDSSAALASSPLDSSDDSSRRHPLAFGTNQNEESFSKTSPPAQEEEHSNPSHKTKTAMNSPRHSKNYAAKRRSRAIAIKPSSPSSSLAAFLQNASSSLMDEDPHMEEDPQSEKLYDMATWRMYNRIVDHRRNQQLSYIDNHKSNSTPAASYLPTTSMASHYAAGVPISRSYGTMTPPPPLADELEGEVFELDL